MTERFRPQHIFVSRENNSLFIDLSSDAHDKDSSQPISISHRIALSGLSLLHLQHALSHALSHRTSFHIAQRLSRESKASTSRHSATILPANSPDIPHRSFWKDHLLSSIKNLGCPYTFEASLQLRPNHFLSDRFLIGIDLRSSLSPSPRQILEFIQCIDFPKQAFYNLLPILSSSDWLHIGYAETTRGPWLKIYCESFQASVDSSSYIRHFAWKYSPLLSQIHESTYTCYPNLTHSQILSRISSFITTDPSSRASKIFDILSQIRLILNLPIFSHSSFDLDFLDVCESHSSHRRSIDLNFYDLSLSISDISPFVFAIAQHLSINIPNICDFLTPILDSRLGHLSFGIDRDNLPFFTIYHGASEHPNS